MTRLLVLCVAVCSLSFFFALQYYNLQVIQNAGQYHGFAHWGRTGTKGQSQLDGPHATPEPAIDFFKAKFVARATSFFSIMSL